jgi:hypothetical protein
MQPSAWIDGLAKPAGGAGALTPQLRKALSSLDQVLFNMWGLGNNMVIAWTRENMQLRFLAVRHYNIIEAFGLDAGMSHTRPNNSSAINRILAGPKFHDFCDFERIRQLFGSAAQVVDARWDMHEGTNDASLISDLVARYGVTLVREGAVLLLDIVGFSLRSPLEQVAMLNSLSYSVNSAYCQLLARDIHINFARTSTGDGYYIWNRNANAESNIAIYKLLMLTLADNAVAHSKAKSFPVPELRAAFHIGEYYEFCHVEALNPTSYGYIVGQVTIDLSRMLDRALPGQILLGEFGAAMNSVAGESDSMLTTRAFVEATEATLDELNGMAVSDDNVNKIRCYLTGRPVSGGGFTVDPYPIHDKHGVTRQVYNAKINIHLNRLAPIYLGIQHRALARQIGIARARTAELALVADRRHRLH